MSNLEFIEAFICPYCKHSIKHFSQHGTSYIDYECQCKMASFYHYTDSNHYVMFLNLPGPYQLQIYVGQYEQYPFRLVEFPAKDQIVNVWTAEHLNLDHIPDLDYSNVDKLMKQLEILVTFQ